MAQTDDHPYLYGRFYLGAIAGAVVGLSDVASAGVRTVFAVGLVSGVGGSGTLTNLAAKVQAESKTVRITNSLRQSKEHDEKIDDKAREIRKQIDNLKQSAEGNDVGLEGLSDSSSQLDNLSATTSELLGMTQSSPTLTTLSEGRSSVEY